ncbi:hypothetical protein RKD27_000636 [Streptomyces sp. SAI-126]|nr:hypothetical protein [Streptomyces sp. SAI-119]MDH6494115.1 hypothetical protein [Streptomyces sp. SAI-149]
MKRTIGQSIAATFAVAGFLVWNHTGTFFDEPQV